MKQLDLNTFGGSRAAIRLAEMVNEREFNASKITRILTSFNKMIYKTNHIDVTSAIYLMKLVYEDSLKKCDALEVPFNTYTKNALSASYKIWNKRKNTQQPRKNRKS